MTNRAPIDGDIHIGDVIGPCLCLAGALAAVVGVFIYALFYLSRPTVYPNPGVAAYHAPPATVLGPQPRVSSAFDIPPEPLTPDQSSAFAELAGASASPDPAKDAPSSAQKHARSLRDPSRDSGLRAFGYVEPPGNSFQWNTYRGDAFRGSVNNNSSFAIRPRMSGGPKSPF
jgi:hypothetical protein